MTNETNEIWIQGFSNDVEDVAFAAFKAGYSRACNGSVSELEINEAFNTWLERPQDNE